MMEKPTKVLAIDLLSNTVSFSEVFFIYFESQFSFIGQIIRIIYIQYFITEPCKECPKGTGIEVYSKTSNRDYEYAPGIYGHYQLQSDLINGRAYFKSRPTSKYAIWWDGIDSWNIGFESKIGTKSCFGYFVQDVLCPHQIKEWNGMLNYGNFGTDNPWVSAGNSLCLR